MSASRNILFVSAGSEDEKNLLRATVTSGLKRPPNSSFHVRRQQATPATICGFLNGDPNIPRTADTGYDCRVDTLQGLWGFCPTTLVSAADCGMVGACIDPAECSKGRGQIGSSGATTVTWYAKLNKPVLLNSYLATRYRSGLLIYYLWKYVHYSNLSGASNTSHNNNNVDNFNERENNLVYTIILVSILVNTDHQFYNRLTTKLI
ncbi:hypothetical protein G7Y89_g4124 [Cudoniella acicularis]|uniref:Uncharacterized protein n=1 Tax=Cudoniella acicularis TaxID=354080 RepID=A0A8H4RRB8_9HELO|nr:hypothetical protein G7Y89_g4124 [Cudoniella acicularis]